MPGTFSPPPRVSDPDMHLGTRVTHVPWCMPGSLTSGFIWRRWRGFPAFPEHAQPAILHIWWGVQGCIQSCACGSQLASPNKHRIWIPWVIWSAPATESVISSKVFNHLSNRAIFLTTADSVWNEVVVSNYSQTSYSYLFRFIHIGMIFAVYDVLVSTRYMYCKNIASQRFVHIRSINLLFLNPPASDET